MFRKVIQRIKEIRAESHVIATFTARIEHGTIDVQTADAYILEDIVDAVVDSIERREGKLTIFLVKKSKKLSKGTCYTVTVNDKIMFVRQTNAKSKTKSFIEEIICLGS